MKTISSPLKSIRLHCLSCCLNQPSEVRYCGASGCNSHPLRMGKRVEGLNVLKTIREHCKQCGGWEEKPRDCQVTDCELFPFRCGKNPNRAGLGGNPSNLIRKPPTKSSIQGRAPIATSLCPSDGKSTACMCSDRGQE